FVARSDLPRLFADSASSGSPRCVHATTREPSELIRLPAITVSSAARRDPQSAHSAKIPGSAPQACPEKQPPPISLAACLSLDSSLLSPFSPCLYSLIFPIASKF